MDTLAEVQTYLLGPIVGQWIARQKAAERSKERFSTIAKLCRQFYGSSAKAMWEDEFRAQFFPTLEKPAFQINLNKAFELIAVIGPNLYWRNPERKVQSYRAPNQTTLAQILGVQDEQFLQQVAQQQQMSEVVRDLRNSMATLVLDYTQQEQPNTLKPEVEQCINEFLMTGLGLMWTESYEHPGTGEFLVQNKFGSVDDLLVDPDCKKPDWSDARWISVKHYDPVWSVERKFGYPPGYLTGRGTRVSAEYQTGEDYQSNERYCDMIEWYEVWSTGGVGARVGGVDAAKSQFFDQQIGDYAYLCVTPNVPHPLNVPPLLMANGSIEEVKEALRWRAPNFGVIHELWKDSRWPVVPLYSYACPGSAWPLAPLAAGLGHLIAMNIIMVAKLSQAWDKRREIIGVATEIQDKVTAALKSDQSPALIPLNPVIGKPINELIQRLERGDSSDDLLQWMEYLGAEFAKATGLLDIHYGMTRTQARVSSDIDAKNRAATVRPDKMRSDIVDWVQKFSTSELWLCCQYMSGEQLTPLLGPWGAIFWEQNIRSMPFEVLVREMTCFIDAKDIERPDNARDLDALNNIAQPYLQLATTYSAQTGDPNPINGFIQRLAQAMDMRDPETLMFGSFIPQPDPQAQQMQQQLAQLEMAEKQAKIDETQAKSFGRITDTQFKMRGLTPQMLTQIQNNDLKFRQKLQQDMDRHVQELMQNDEMFQQTLQQVKQKASASRSTVL